jgi:hypothetical protein
VGNGSGLSAATKSSIASYASSGGNVIVLGSHGGQSGFLNSVFGFSTTDGGSQGSGETINRVAGNGPLTLPALNATWYINNAPGGVTYTGNGGATAAFTVPFGSGHVSFIAFDFFDSSAASASAPWYQVLANDVNVPEPTSIVVFGAMGVAGAFYGWRRRRGMAA